MKADMDKKVGKFPDFLIVGAAKSGTTSLHHYLVDHPEIYMPDIKETWFFHQIDNPNKAILEKMPWLPLDLPSYTKLFSDAKGDQICGESTPSYLYYYDRTIRNLKKLHPKWQEVKIVIILREPISKVISHYRFVKNHQLDPENLSLKQSLRIENERLRQNKVLLDLFYVDNTKYYQQVKAFKKEFKNVKVYLYDDLRDDAEALIKDLYQYLEVDSTYTPSTIEKAFNRSNKKTKPIFSSIDPYINGKARGRRFIPQKLKDLVKEYLYIEEKIDAETVQFLKDSFKEDVEKLQDLIDRDLASWLKRYQ